MRFATLALGFLLGAIVFIGASLVLAWTGPSAAPPNGNVSAPINVGATDQVKNAGLGLNSLAVFGNSILSGPSVTYLNFGATSGSTGYGIRDNAGAIEFKNSGGAWTGLAAGGRIPGEVAAFNLSACPPGWTALTGAAGRFIVGVGSNGTTTYALDASGGADTRTLTVAQLPPHSHTVTVNYSYPSTVYATGFGTGYALGGATTLTTSAAGTGAPIDFRPTYYALLYCQKN